MKNNNLIKLKRYVKYIIKKTYREEIERMQKENSIEELNDIQQATKDILILRRLNTKVGTFSDYIIFLKSIEYAIEVGKIPIVDRQTLKNDFMPAPDNINAWELFFEQPLGYGLSDIDYDTMSVSVCYNGGGMFPVSIMKCADENVVAYWRNIARKYIRLNENMRTYVEDKYTELLDGKRVLGVSVREGYQKHLNGNSDISDEIIADMENRFHQAINDDMNMPLALSVVWEAVKYPEKSPKIAQLLKKFDTVLGIKIDEVQETKIPQEILDLVEERKQARSDKNWSESDRLRDLIAEKGYIVKDTKDGTEVLKK